MESMIEQRVRNFRLDSRLKRACQGEIYDTCAYLGDMDTVSDDDSIIINCLQVMMGHLYHNVPLLSPGSCCNYIM